MSATWKTWAEGRPKKWPVLLAHIENGVVQHCNSAYPATPLNSAYWTHWMDIPELPVKSQEDEDEAAFQDWYNSKPGISIRKTWHDAKAHERAAVLAEWEKRPGWVKPPWWANQPSADNFGNWLRKRCGRDKS